MYLPDTFKTSSIRNCAVQKPARSLIHSLCLVALIVAAGVVSAQEAAQAQQQPATAAHIQSQTFNWSELNRVYRAAMAEYNKKRASKNASSFDVTRQLEKAGIAQAIETPVKDMSPQQAAAILNDYGFLAGSQPLAEPALRRAIELDPKRRAAYLNLADLLRNRMPNGASSWDGIMTQWQEAEKLYRQYLALGGKQTPQIREFLKGDLDAANLADICEAIALYANAGRLKEIIFTEESKGIQIQGRKFDFRFTALGPSYVPFFDVTDSITGKELDDKDWPWTRFPRSNSSDDGYSAGDYFGLAIYHNDIHILHYRDFQHPVKTFSLADKKNCAFKNKTIEKIGPKAGDPAACKQLVADAKVTPVVFKESMAQFDARKVYGVTNAEEIGIAGVAQVDIANNGKLANIALLHLVSSAGTGCGEAFYDVLNTKNSGFLPGKVRDLLMEMQNADPGNRYPVIHCHNNPRLFLYNGKNYFESKPSQWPPVDNFEQYHYVRKIENNKVIDICDYQFETKTSVTKQN